MNRGIGKVTMWLPKKKNSHVRIIENGTGKGAKIQFQNEKFDVLEFELDSSDLIELFEMNEFLGKK